MRRILADGAFDQGAIDLMIEAYEAICQKLDLREGKYDPASEAVATAVMELVRDGERDVQRITARVIEKIQPRRL